MESNISDILLSRYCVLWMNVPIYRVDLSSFQLISYSLQFTGKNMEANYDKY